MGRATLSGLRVLVVEDEMLVSLLIEDVLVEEGCTIVGPFNRVDAALIAARTEKIDLAVLDVNLAGVKVFPVADALAERGVPFLFLSDYGEHAAPPSHPEWRVCSKPFRPEELTQKLRDQLTAQK